jgi:hypothetical protein
VHSLEAEARNKTENGNNTKYDYISQVYLIHNGFPHVLLYHQRSKYEWDAEYAYRNCPGEGFFFY